MHSVSFAADIMCTFSIYYFASVDSTLMTTFLFTAVWR